MLTANPVSSVLCPTKSVLFPENRSRTLLELHTVECETPVDDPQPGRFRFWTADWSVAHMIGVCAKHGLPVIESMHLTSRPFAKIGLKTGFLTVPLVPPRSRNDGPYRKIHQLKQCERLANLAEIMMAMLQMYCGELEILHGGVWLMTSDMVKDKRLCVMSTESGIFVEPHSEDKIAHNNHGCAVVYDC
jgi:hypothetical protein